MNNSEIKNNEPIPVFKSWNGWYILTILLLVVQVVFFDYLTQFFK